MSLDTSTVAGTCAQARSASRELAVAPGDTRDAALRALALALADDAPQILAAAQEDAAQDGTRPLVSARRLEALRDHCLRVAAMEDPLGRVLEGRELPNGLTVRRVRVPLGVIAWVYQDRPHTVVEAAAMCLKTGNALVALGRGGGERASARLAATIGRAVAGAGLPPAAVQLIERADDDALLELVRQDRHVDLVKQRGGASLRERLAGVATVPVVYAIDGNCHVYVDAAADLEMATEIVLDAKVAKPGRCDAAETLLVHQAVAERFLPGMLRRLADAGVTLHADERAAAVAAAAGVPAEPATDDDWEHEYTGLELAVGVVDSVRAAAAHVNRFGTGHSEAIVTDSVRAADEFTARVDAACVAVNASTRFTDGADLGLGVEFGNSTQKLHVRGPIGLDGLCSYKWVIAGAGHLKDRATAPSPRA